MSELSEINKRARDCGLSYGEYISLYRSTPKPQKPPTNPPKSKKRYSDEAAFALWQAGKSDAQIGSELGVSRAIIQRWRDTLELPSNSKSQTDTSKYKLIQTEDGIFAVKE